MSVDILRECVKAYMKKKSIQTNINLTREDHEKLIAMMNSDGYLTKSPFVRWLIRQEFNRRSTSENTATSSEKIAIAGNM